LPTQLTYSLITEPFPLEASTDSGSTRPAKLTIIASNPHPDKPVTIKKKISITLPIGPAARDLTNTPPANVVAPEDWTPPSKPRLGDGVAVYDFTPNPGHKEIGKQGLSFIFNDVKVNQQPGSCLIEITEVITDTDEYDTTLSVAKFPHGWGEVSFAVDPANIKAGEKTTLEWAGPPGALYKIEYAKGQDPAWIPAKSTDPPLANVGKYPGDKDPPLMPEVTTDFTLHVWLDVSGRKYHGTQQRRVTVIPRPPSIEYFRPRACQQGGDCFIYNDEFALEWEIKNVDPQYCQLTQDWPEFPDRQPQVIQWPWQTNFVVVRPTEKQTRYTLMVKKDSTQLTATVNATLIPPVPVGTIVPYGALLANNLPTGWLYCNGNEYPKAQYPQLYPVILDTYGTARSTANGKLPDLRGYFVRGYDDGRGIDPGRKMGSLQDDIFRSHTHGQKVTANPNTGSCTRSDFNGDSKTYSEYEQGVQTYAEGGIETRPKNLATYFVIYAGVYKAPTRKPGKKSNTSKKSAAGRGRGAGRMGGGR